MLALSLLLAVAPQNPITLPPRPKPAPRSVATETARTFEQDVLALRRTAGSRLVESGAELALTAQVLGHASVDLACRAGINRAGWALHTARCLRLGYAWLALAGGWRLRRLLASACDSATGMMGMLIPA